MVNVGMTQYYWYYGVCGSFEFYLAGGGGEMDVDRWVRMV